MLIFNFTINVQGTVLNRGFNFKQTPENYDHSDLAVDIRSFSRLICRLEERERERERERDSDRRKSMEHGHRTTMQTFQILLLIADNVKSFKEKKPSQKNFSVFPIKKLISLIPARDYLRQPSMIELVMIDLMEFIVK